MSHKSAPVEFLMNCNAEAIECCDDLLIKILLFLPARPLFTFKLVSKRWLCLISDPYFSSLWKPKAFPSALFLQPLSSWYSEDPYCISLKENAEPMASCSVLDFVKGDPNDVVEVLSSCGGLVLCSRYRRSWNDEYFVCNPTTKTFDALPSPTLVSLHMSLAFDHSMSPHYEVISVGHCLRIEIYSSATKSWRCSLAQFPEPSESYLACAVGVFFNGAIFWMFSELRSFFYFDIVRESLHHSNFMPPGYLFFCFCGSVHGKLHLVGSLVSELQHIEIFELGNDFSSWSHKYRIKRDLTISLGDFARGSSSLEFALYLIYSGAIKTIQKPYLDLYMLHIFKCICFESSVRLVHHLIENPFWVGIS